MPTDVFESEAFKLVEAIVENALKEYHKTQEELIDYETALFQLTEDGKLQERNDLLFVEKEDDFAVKNITWPTNGEFTVELGENKIDEFIKKTWEYDNCWLYCIDFLEKVEKEFTNLYQYRVRWSVPTRRKPVPQFTAHVYFTFDVSKIKPKTSTVNVYYIFETQRLVHKPGMSRFRQQWINDILNLKESLIKNFNY